jgi:hypothetical protein
MSRRFSGTNRVAGGFLGNLGERHISGGTGADESREGRLLMRRADFTLGAKSGQFNTKDRMNIVCLARSTSQRSTTFVDQLATSACLSLLISMAIRRSTLRNGRSADSWWLVGNQKLHHYSRARKLDKILSRSSPRDARSKAPQTRRTLKSTGSPDLTSIFRRL